jgi:ankyrin repeat protein
MSALRPASTWTPRRSLGCPGQLRRGESGQGGNLAAKSLLHAIFTQSNPNKEILSLLISKGADVNSKDCEGRTPLHCACNFDFDVSTASVQSGKEVNGENYKRSILYNTILSDTSKAKIILFLLENGASVNAKDSANRSVLHYAAFQRNYNCVKVLLDHGADINAVCDSGKTVLHAAFEKVLSSDVVVIQLLLSHGVDSNKRDKNQKTALDYAVTSTGSDRVVNILFDATAHDQLKSTNCITFLHYAVYHGNCFAVELFLNGELDLDNVDVNNEEYPLYFAVENQHLRSELLLKMTKFIRDCKKKANFRRKRIVELLEEYFSKGYGPDHVPVRDDDLDHFDSSLEEIKSSNNLCSSDLRDSLYSSYDYSEDEYDHSPDYNYQSY